MQGVRVAFLFSKAKWAIGRKKVDLEAEDLGLLLVMEDSTVPDQEDVEFLSEFTDLDEYDGANYARKTLANKALAQDLAANVARLTADDLAWIGLGAGTRKCIGALLFAEAASDALRRPLAYIDGPSFPFEGEGVDKFLVWHDDGILVIV